MLSYIFWPNPPAPYYSDTKVVVVVSVCIALVVCSFLIKRWRKTLDNAVTRKLSRSWAASSLWFGLVGLFLAVCRVEGISYLSMRLWWFVWAISAVCIVGFQVKMYRTRHYELVPQEKAQEDPREKYLPKKKT